ncbi:MAG: esterase [Candidatus Eremiobacteraeota bacterium]|nr:esterase [Candidatus Eremiobacteraeota bacterium]
MRRLAVFVAILMLSGLRPLQGSADAASGSRSTIEIGGAQREYIIHVPPSYDRVHAVPLVLVLHGGGGAAAGMESLAGMDPVADKNDFIAVYPQGLNRHWKDGRTPALSGDDDVAFIRALIASLEAQYRIDPKRIYATGISNGAFFSFRLACDLGDEIAAIAPVAGSLAAGSAPHCNGPVSIMMINGTADPLVPFNGGPVAAAIGGQGESMPVSQAASTWAAIDGCDPTPSRDTLPQAQPPDGTTTRVQTFSRCRGGSAVLLYTIENGGHTWPDGPQYLPAFMIGKVSHDFNAGSAIWDFFAAHPRAL